MSSIDDPINDDVTSNDDRASWAEAALLAFAQRTGMAQEMVGDKEDAFFIVSDLLADLGPLVRPSPGGSGGGVGTRGPALSRGNQRVWEAVQLMKARPVTKKQKRPASTTPARQAPARRRPRGRRLPPGCVRYEEMKGRTVERIEVWFGSHDPCVSVRFEDKTDFTVEIDTRLVLSAIHSDLRTGNMRVLKRWPAAGIEEA